MILICAVLAVILAIVIWFNIPYSPVKIQFKTDVKIRSKASNAASNSFTQADFEMLPAPIQKYLEKCGYIGSLKKAVLNMEYKNVDFAQGKNGPKLKINYSQYNFSDAPDRLAFIDAKMFGIPFQGYDYYLNSTGGMKGVLAKSFTLFNQTGPEMNKACLVTYLAESLFLPQSLLSGFITFTQIDEYTVEAKIKNGESEATGIFTFNTDYEMTSFTTKDRAQIANDGTLEYIPWSAECQDYVVYSDGIKRPTKFRAVWNYPEKPFVYFDGDISQVDGATVKTFKN